MTFEFATAGRIVFGPGTLNTVAAAATGCGRRALVVTGATPRFHARLAAVLERGGIAATRYAVVGEPRVEDIAAGVSAAREWGADFVIGLGGGSALDAAKAIAAMLTNPGPLTDYLEVIGAGRSLPVAPAPCLALPTTAGTGAEVTRNAVLASPAHRVKVSLRSPLMLPRVAVVDPELTYELSPAVTAATGLDALTQLLEPYVSCRANALTDPLCVDGLRRAARSLRQAVEAPSPAAREDMSMASLFGGLALANAGLGAVHGFAGPIGGAFPAPHGAVCAALLAAVTNLNVRALRARAPQSDALRRYDELGRVVTGRPQATADDLVVWLRELVTALAIPRLSAYGVGANDVPALVAAALKASSMKANPLPLTADECTEILQEAL